MKTTKLVTAVLCAFGMLATTSLVPAQEKEEKKPCCEATVEAGKKCKHECCVKAAEAGKVCDKCHPKKDEKKEK
jgi:hypothetical protein